MMQEKRIEEQLIVCGKSYRILRLLGHGKGGYSYLAESEGQPAVIKQIHHEPCDYYAFGSIQRAPLMNFSLLIFHLIAPEGKKPHLLLAAKFDDPSPRAVNVR